ncbi:MAG: tetratricopeptide repeat protein, partial [Burkholderiales bacterium]
QLSADVEGIDLQETFGIPVRRVAGVDVPRASQGMLDAPVATHSSSGAYPELPGREAGAAQPRKQAPVSAAGMLFVALLGIAFLEWPLIRAHLGIGDADPAAGQRTAGTPRAQKQQAVGTQPAPVGRRSEPSPVPDDWQAHFRLGAQAKLEQRPRDALHSYGEALAIIQRTRGADHPLAAVMHERIADIHTGHRRHAEAETALRSALAILEKYPHDAVRAQGGRLVRGCDRESVLRGLGWALWEQRRYADALQAYQRAYDTVAELDIDERDRNRRLAYSAAGIMAAACTQREWARADRAMAELKERMSRVAAADRKWLEYWVRTGEPRLSARKC